MSHKRRTFGSVYQRGKVWYLRVRTPEGEFKRAAGQDRKLAEMKLAELRAKWEREKILGVKEIGLVTLGGFWPTVEPVLRGRLTPHGLRVNAGMFLRAVGHFGKKPLASITAADVSDFGTWLRTSRGVSPATVNRHLALLSVVFREAVERDFARENPVARVKRQREETKAIPWVPLADLRRLLAVVPAAFRCFVVLGMETGCRRGELERLEWADVNLSRGVLLVAKSKSGRPREIPLTAAARAMLEGMEPDRAPRPIRGPDLVFPGLDVGRASRLFPQWSVAAGLPRLRLHDMRHAFCSRLAQAGIPIPTIAKLAGHSNLTTTMRYACHSPENAGVLAIRALEAAEGTPAPAAAQVVAG